jgi:hypothetical protein
MKNLMQAIFELLSDFMENGIYNIFSNTITFDYNGKTYRLSLDEVKED